MMKEGIIHELVPGYPVHGLKHLLVIDTLLLIEFISLCLLPFASNESNFEIMLSLV
ncbi:MAG: hypothetical protein R2727_05520 [Bacteroidales bacterium]